MQTTSTDHSVVQGQAKIIPGVTPKYTYEVDVFTIHIPQKPEMIQVYKKTGKVNYYKDPVTKMPIIGPDGHPVPKLVSDIRVIRKMTLTAIPGMPLPPGCTTHMRVTLMFNSPRVPCSQCQEERKLAKLSIETKWLADLYVKDKGLAELIMADGDLAKQYMEEMGIVHNPGDNEMTQLPEELTRVCTHGKGGNGVQVEKEDRRAVYSITAVKETHPVWYEVERCKKAGLPPPPVVYDMETITKKDKLGFEREVTQMKYSALPSKKTTKGEAPMGYLECHNFLKWLLGDQVTGAMYSLLNDKPSKG